MKLTKAECQIMNALWEKHPATALENAVQEQNGLLDGLPLLRILHGGGVGLRPG